MISETQLIGKS